MLVGLESFVDEKYFRRRLFGFFLLAIFIVLASISSFSSSSIADEDLPNIIVQPLETGCAVQDIEITSDEQWTEDVCYGNVTISNGATLTLYGGNTYEFQTLTVGDDETNGTVLAGTTGTEPSALTVIGDAVITSTGTLTVTQGLAHEFNFNNLSINSGGRINADGKGYGPGQGPGASDSSLIGASHGGLGRLNATDSAYGSPTQPTTMGSGGVSINGGGAIKLNISGTLNNNGSITANGLGVSSRSAAGGSIWINFTNETTELTGAGTIAANAINTSYSGGGGRIAITGYGTNNFEGTITAEGGAYSGVGTIYTRSHQEANGTLLIRGTHANNFYTPLVQDDLNGIDNLFVSNFAKAHVNTQVEPQDMTLSLEANGSLVIGSEGDFSFGEGVSLNFAQGSHVQNMGTFNYNEVETSTINGTYTIDSGSINVFPNNLTIGSTGILTVQQGVAHEISFNNLSIEPGGKIDANGKGYGAGQGPGASNSTSVGSSHGGIGRLNTNSSSYGSPTQPTTMGSGGVSINGGGAIKLNISGTLNNNGAITANGNGASSRSAAGGSIWINFTNDTTEITGAGTIAANTINTSYPGGGGRIAITGYGTNNFEGTITAEGGTYSGSGTIYERQVNSTHGTLSITGTGHQLNSFTPISQHLDGVNELAVDNFAKILLTTKLEPNNSFVLNLKNNAEFHIDTQGELILGETTEINSSGSTFIINNGLFAATSDSIDINSQLSNSGTFDLSESSDLTINSTYIGNANSINLFPSDVVIGPTGIVTFEQGQPIELDFHNLFIDEGGQINGTAKGYARRAGPGAGAASVGANHAGHGYENYGDTYGSVTQPMTMGSGGYTAEGGGALKITISNSLTNNGAITANGGSNTGGTCTSSSAGAGGSIWIDFINNDTTFNGNGTISADTGLVLCRNGGGGRISIDGYGTNNFAGVISARGHTQTGNGTIFTRASNQLKGTLEISGNLTLNRPTPIRSEDLVEVTTLAAHTYGNILIASDITSSANFTLDLEANGRLTVDPTGSLVFSEQNELILSTTSTITNDGTIDTSLLDTLVINGTYSSSSAATNIFPSEVILTSTGILTLPQGEPVEFTFENLVVEHGGAIDAYAKGYGPTQGPGAGISSGYMGASHGGIGGANPAPVYGSITQPTTMGSGARSRSGGGAVKLNVASSLTLDGTINANAESGGGCPNASSYGAGGSIWINFTGETSVFDGAGSLSANGGTNTSGSTPFCTKGGGGRIAITGYDTNEFEGTITANTAGSSNYGDAGTGTIYLHQANISHGDLLLQNTTPTTGETPIAENLSLKNLDVTTRAVLSIEPEVELKIVDGSVEIESNAHAIVKGDLKTVGSTMVIDGKLTLNGTHQQSWGHVIVGNNGTLTHAPNTDQHLNHVNIQAESLSVSTGGKIIADAKGFTGGEIAQDGFGPGAGSGTESGGAGGAGHGGQGADGSGATGGGTYGDLEHPATLGSGGGGGISGAGGAGGGLIILDITGTLNNSGTISADGQNGEISAGGGSGGSIDITAGTLNCSDGSITANGGIGGINAGQGGGGRIAYHTSEYIQCSDLSVSGAQNGTINQAIIVNTPTDFQVLSKTHNSVTWTWTDTSTNETEFRIYDNEGNLRGTRTSTTTEQTGSTITYTETGLTPNTLHNRRVVAVAGTNEGQRSTNVLVQTFAQTPSSPIAQVLSPNEIRIRVGSDSNPAQTLYSFAEDNSGKFIQADGTFGDEPMWQTKSQWNGDSGVVIPDLDPNTSYSFKVKARSDDYVETIYSVRSITTYAPPPPPPVVEPEETTVTISVPGAGSGSSGSGWAFRCGEDSYIQTNGRCGSTKVFHPTPEIIVTDLEPGTTYTFDVVTINHDGIETQYSEPVTVVTLALKPELPELAVISHNEAKITLAQDMNPDYTTYAILETTTNRWLQNDSTLETSPAWHTKAQWNFDEGFNILGLSPNTQYRFSVVAQNTANINTAYTDAISIRTYAQRPLSPVVEDMALNSFVLKLRSGANPSATQYSIQIDESYLQANGTLGNEITWQTYDAWGASAGVNVSPLEENTLYEISVIARNGDNINTEKSESIEVRTLRTDPTAPELTPISDELINVKINSDLYDLTYEFAIIEVSTSSFVNQSGKLAQQPHWRTYTAWGADSGVDVSGLNPNTQYSFATIARDIDSNEDIQSSVSHAFTFAQSPGIEISNITNSSATITLINEMNPNSTKYSIKFNGGYINEFGQSIDHPLWLEKDSWQAIEISTLSPETLYEIETFAINDAEAITSPTTASFTTHPLPTEPSEGDETGNDTDDGTTPIDLEPQDDNPDDIEDGSSEEEGELADVGTEVNDKEEVKETSSPITVIGTQASTGAWILLTIYNALSILFSGLAILLINRLTRRRI